MSQNLPSSSPPPPQSGHYSYPPQQTVIIANRQSQAIPALANFLCFPGLGQLIQGRLAAALGWWLLAFAAALSIWICVGVVLYPIVVIACVLDAARFDPDAAYAAGYRPASVSVRAVLGGVAAVIVLPILGLAMLGTITSSIPPPREVRSTPPATPQMPVIDSVEIQPESNSVPEKTAVAAEVVEPKPPSVALEPVTDISTPPVPQESPPHESPPEVKIIRSNPVSRVPVDRNEMRDWTDATGQYKVRAKFRSLVNGVAKLEREDGQVIEVPIEKMSEPDRSFIRDKR